MALLSLTFFLGRFHPVLVHLPIGFILIAILLEWRLKEQRPSKAIAYAWMLSAISSGIAALMGWFLANEGSYDNWTLFAHRWLGIFIGVFCLYAWYIRRNNRPSKLMSRVTNIGAIVLLLVIGHLGGNMTHGSDYLLEHAPKPVQKLLGYGDRPDAYPQYSDPDSVLVFEDLIAPTLQQKCWSCHNDDVQNGGLNITSLAGLLEGGDGGPSVIAGDINSEIIRRVVLPPSSSKFMPSSGTPMTYHEVKLLEWWVSQGAEGHVYASNINANPSVQSTLMDLFGLDLIPRPWIEKTKVAPPSNDVLERINSKNFVASMISSDNGWVEVSLPYGTQLGQNQLAALSEISEQVTWLKLSNANITDSDLFQLASLKNLTSLKLDGNDITSEGIKHFTSLSQLEVLNLVNTKVDDGIFDIIPHLPALKTLYLWESGVTDEAVQQARNKFSELEITTGL